MLFFLLLKDRIAWVRPNMYPSLFSSADEGDGLGHLEQLLFANFLLNVQQKTVSVRTKSSLQ